MAAKKTPMRMCVACREMKPKRELIRIVRTPETKYAPTPPAAQPGAAHIYAKVKRALKRR